MKLALPQFGAHIHSQGGKLAAIVRAPLVNGAEQPPIALILTDVEFESKWGEYGKLIEGAASRTDGKANTAAMLAAGCPAAAQLAELEAEGHNDLFIPAIGQLNAAACNVPELFAPTGCTGPARRPRATTPSSRSSPTATAAGAPSTTSFGSVPSARFRLST
jgi:hypothetical protein